MLEALPLCFALVGLALYGVLAGADFGAGFWQLTAGRGRDAERIREHAHDSMAPVWEANHVWLIFVLTVVWTAYPTAFGSIASTLSVALFIAGIGIIFRGAAYALRSGGKRAREVRAIDTAFGASSVITPFALGAAVGGIASGRVPVGNAAGDLFTSWLNPTSILVGVLAVVTGAYIAAVFLCGDAVRGGHEDLADRFRTRALGAAVVAGAIAIGGLFVLRSDAHRLYSGLVSGSGLPALIASVLAGMATLALVWRRRYEPARLTAALAVAAIVAGWALAQKPEILPGLSVGQAAASHDTLVTVGVAVVAGGLLLFPALGTLFRLVLRGRFDHAEDAGDTATPEAARVDSEQRQARPSGARAAAAPHNPALLVRIAGALLVAGAGFTNVADADWAHVVGATCFLAFIATAFRAALPLPEPS
jgi:cytochrome d ubiquinol oxidase subunit II